jgi:hypothetical protein
MQWKQIQDYPLYEVSDTGEVRNTRSGKLLRGRKTPVGYLRVVLFNHAGKRQFSIHRLVAFAFVAPRYAAEQVNHVNGDKHDNRAENLEWVTAQENCAHARHVLGRKKVAPKGMKSPKAKLTDDQVRMILSRDDLSRYGRTIQLARELGIATGTVRQIRKRETWRHI